MFAFLRGLLSQAMPTYAIIDVAGVGYKVSIPSNLFGKLPESGQEIFLHTTLVIRENMHCLYGFSSPEERDLFEVLVEQVTGVGPKVALSIIGNITLTDLQRAVSSGDIRAISKVPGVGKKTAERLIVEMKDKLFKVTSCNPSNWAVHLPQNPQKQAESDVLGALINLGYAQSKAERAAAKTIAQAEDLSNLGALITEALKHV